jgi:segregation and condensation protein B
MAARKRKIAQPKQVAEVHTEPELGADGEGESGEPAAEAAEAAEAESPVPDTDEAVARAEAEAEAPPDSESERVTLPPRSRVTGAQAESPESPESLESLESSESSESQPESGQELLGAGPSEVDESRVDDTGAYLKGLLEALLFVSDRPLEIKDLARAAKIDKKRVEELVQEIRSDYQNRGVRLDEVGDGFAFRSNPAYSEYVRGYLSLRPVRLSRAQLETLSIVAYRQPITRPEVDDIRGVDAGPVLKGLLERDLVRIIGKKDEPGRPMLYGTTQTFLQVFSLKSLRDLPTLREFTELNDESRKTFEEELGEEAPEGPISFEDAMAADASLDAPNSVDSESALDAFSDSEAEAGSDESTERTAAEATESDDAESDDAESDDAESDDAESDDAESDDAESDDDDDDDESDEDKPAEDK